MKFEEGEGALTDSYRRTIGPALYMRIKGAVDRKHLDLLRLVPEAWLYYFILAVAGQQVLTVDLRDCANGA